ncbi:MAG: hypothetical protein ACOX2O_09710 [Bdellovibrionota bacterium]
MDNHKSLTPQDLLRELKSLAIEKESNNRTIINGHDDCSILDAAELEGVTAIPDAAECEGVTTVYSFQGKVQPRLVALLGNPCRKSYDAFRDKLACRDGFPKGLSPVDVLASSLSFNEGFPALRRAIDEAMAEDYCLRESFPIPAHLKMHVNTITGKINASKDLVSKNLLKIIPASQLDDFLYGCFVNVRKIYAYLKLGLIFP